MNETPQNPLWVTQLLNDLEIDDVYIDQPQLEKLEAAAGENIIGFIAGYAVGLAEGTGQADFPAAQRAALKFISRWISEISEDHPHHNTQEQE